MHMRKRERETANDTELVTDVKSGKFFPAPFPDKCERGKRALGANRKRECFVFCYVDEMGRTALDCQAECLTIILIFLRTLFPQLTETSSLCLCVIIKYATSKCSSTRKEKALKNFMHDICAKILTSYFNVHQVYIFNSLIIC